MREFVLPYFEKINLDALEEYYKIETIIDKSSVQIDLNFEKTKIDYDLGERIKTFLKSVIDINNSNQNEYLKDYKESGETDAYIQFYIEEFDEEELNELIEIESEEEKHEEKLLNKLDLTRIGIYPNQEDGLFGVFDYSIKIEGEYCNHLLVVKVDEKGGLDHITWES